MKGYGGRILFVDATSASSRVEPVSEELARSLLGGNGFAARLLLYHVPSGADAYDPANAEAGRTGAVTTQGLLALRKQAQRMNPQLAADRGTVADLAWENFVKEVFLDATRHRVARSIRAQAEDIGADHLLGELLRAVPIP